MNLFDAKYYQQQVNFGDIGEHDHNVVQGAMLAIWLYVDKKKSLKQACKIASKNKNAPVGRVEKCLRLAIPKEMIQSRKGWNMPEDLKQEIQAQKINEHICKKHFESI